jgi:hypothetical protein
MAHLFSELHRRHPDVDLVLLPPEEPPADVPPPTDEVVRATLIRTVSAVRRLRSAAAPDSRVEPDVRWSYAADPGRVRAVARVVERRTDGLAVLVRLRHELESDGWEVSRPPGGLERLGGVLDDGDLALDLTASWAEQSGALVLTVSSAPLAVGRERATALAGGR